MASSVSNFWRIISLRCSLESCIKSILQSRRKIERGLTFYRKIYFNLTLSRILWDNQNGISQHSLFKFNDIQPGPESCIQAYRLDFYLSLYTRNIKYNITLVFKPSNRENFLRTKFIHKIKFLFRNSARFFGW